MKQLTEDEIKDTFKNFHKTIFSLILSTTNKDNSAHTSYSPYIKIDNKYYAVMSSQMPHYKNIINTKAAHIMILEDEKDAFNIYARKRLYFDATCKEVKLSDYYSYFEDRYKEELSFIKTMKDFTLIELTPKIRSIVLGFGSAYMMNEKEELISKNISHK